MGFLSHVVTFQTEYTHGHTPTTTVPGNSSQLPSPQEDRPRDLSLTLTRKTQIVLPKEDTRETGRLPEHPSDR